MDKWDRKLKGERLLVPKNDDEEVDMDDPVPHPNPF